MKRPSLLKSIKFIGLSLPILAGLTYGGVAKAEASDTKCAEIKYAVSVCADKKGEGYEIYSKLGNGLITSTKQYVGLDGVSVTFGTIDVLGTRAQVKGGIRSGPVRLEGKLEACAFSRCTNKNFVLNLTQTSTTAKGIYQLYHNGQQVGYEPAWTQNQAIANLAWNQKQYPNILVEGRFNGVKVGYELFHNGKRVGFEPSWTREQAISNLEWNKKQYPNILVEGSLNGEEIGYELFHNGKRVGFEPSWNADRAIANLEWNKKQYPNIVVEGSLNGRKVGYELFFDGKRVGFEPSWTREQAVNNLKWNLKNNTSVKVEALYAGVPLTP